jgi:class 3 adenylate cyclase
MGMDFYDVVEQVLALLQRHKRVTYRALQRQFNLDEAYLEDLKAEIIEVRQLAVDVAVRLGIHTGLVVVGAMGAGERQEALALGDTPNIAARLHGLAAPDTVAVSDATWRLVQGYFAGHDLGLQTLKGVEHPSRCIACWGRVEHKAGWMWRVPAASRRWPDARPK